VCCVAVVLLCCAVLHANNGVPSTSYPPPSFLRYGNATSGVYVDRLQTHAVMPLATGVVPASVVPLTLSNLEHQIENVDGGHLDTGLTGTYFMTKMLMEAGRNDLIFTWANKTDYPSYGYDTTH
jgi:alpha-L-rhamnosidase